MSSCFLFYHDKFENCPNERNYYKFVNYLQQATSLLKTWRRDFILVQTDDRGVVIFNSNVRNNTWEDYKRGKIGFNSLEEIISVNLGEKQKNVILTSEKRIHFTLKTGSTTTGSTSNDDEDTSGNADTFEEVAGVLSLLAMIAFLTWYLGGFRALERYLDRILDRILGRTGGGMSEEEAKEFIKEYDRRTPFNNIPTYEINGSQIQEVLDGLAPQLRINPLTL